MTKKFLAVGFGVALALSACGGVDKDGMGDKLVEDVESLYGVTLTDSQKDCLKDVVNDMSEDDIKNISDGKASTEVLTEFQADVAVCVPELGGG